MINKKSYFYDYRKNDDRIRRIQYFIASFASQSINKFINDFIAKVRKRLKPYRLVKIF